MTADWYPTPVPAPHEPVAGSVEGSRFFQGLDDTDYIERRSAVGDIPVAGPLRRIGSLLIDMTVCVWAPAAWAAFIDAPDSFAFAMIGLAILGNEIAGFATGERGQTLGRRVFRLQAARVVVTHYGKQAIVDRGMRMNVLRALLHVVDVLLWFVAIPWVIFTRYHRTLADSLTKTVMIRPAEIKTLPRAPRGSHTIA